MNDLSEIKLIFYGLSSMLQFSEFVWALRSSVWVDFNNFLLLDAKDRSKISSDQKRFFIALSLYPLSFFANTPFKKEDHSHIKRQRNLYPCSIAAYFDSSDVVLCIFLGFSISLILVIKKPALQMIHCFPSFLQLDLPGLKPETVLKFRYKVEHFDNSIFLFFNAVNF